jgi:hypothetical protein
METTKKHAKRNTEIYKADSSEMEKRVNTIYLMILQGFQRKQIIQYCSNTYKIGERQTDAYLIKAREIIKANIDCDTSSKKNEVLNQFYDLYQKNYALEDYRECKSVLLAIAGILGVQAPTKTDITSGGEKIATAPPTIVFMDNDNED